MREFKMDDEEFRKYLDWEAKHHTKANCKYFDDGSSPVSPTGAIGGRVTYHLTPTGIGTVVKVTCACGAEEDLTNYDLW